MNECEKYNTIWQRLQWAERRNRCNSELGCVFLGRRLTGTCCVRDLDAHIPSRAIVENPPSDEKNIAFYAELVSDFSNGKDFLPIQVLVKESIKFSAVESLRDSHLIANQLAKNLVIDVFKHPDSINKLGQILQYMFNYDGVLQPTRNLVYWSLGLDVTIQNTNELIKSQRNYYLDGAGYPLTSSAILLQSSQWLSHGNTHKNVLSPNTVTMVKSLLLRDQAEPHSPLVLVTAEAISNSKVLPLSPPTYLFTRIRVEKLQNCVKCV